MVGRVEPPVPPVMRQLQRLPVLTPIALSLAVIIGDDVLAAVPVVSNEALHAALAAAVGAALGARALDEGHEVTLADNWYATERAQLDGLEARVKAVAKEDAPAPKVAAPETAKTTRAPKAPPAPPKDEETAEGARLIALNMALSGEPREATDKYLAENFDLSDREALLDEVYASIEG